MGQLKKTLGELDKLNEHQAEVLRQEGAHMAQLQAAQDAATGDAAIVRKTIPDELKAVRVELANLRETETKLLRDVRALEFKRGEATAKLDTDLLLWSPSFLYADELVEIGQRLVLIGRVVSFPQALHSAGAICRAHGIKLKERKRGLEGQQKFWDNF